MTESNSIGNSKFCEGCRFSNAYFSDASGDVDTGFSFPPDFWLPTTVDDLTACIKPDKLVTPATPSSAKDLGQRFDQPILTYYSVSAELAKEQGNKKMVSLIELEEAFERLKKQRTSSRKLPSSALPSNKKGHYYYDSDFAFAGKTEMLSQILFKRKDATKLRSSPSYMSRFIALDLATHQYEQDEKNFVLSDYSFKFEDYIFFELSTCSSFFIEATAALMSISDEEIRQICTDALIANLDTFCLFDENHLSLLSRIAYMRLFLVRLQSELSSYKLYYNSTLSSSGVSINNEIKRIITQTLIPIQSSFQRYGITTLCNPNPPSHEIFYDNGKGKLIEYNFNLQNRCETLQLCKNRLYKLIEQIHSPINLFNYMKGPIYGPIAFCNPSHKGVKSLLDELSFYHQNSSQSSIPKSKEWLLLAQLFNSLPKE